MGLKPTRSLVQRMVCPTTGKVLEPAGPCLCSQLVVGTKGIFRRVITTLEEKESTQTRPPLIFDQVPPPATTS